MDNEHKETLAEISADIRERAENAKRHGDERPTSGEAIGNLLLSIADRIDRAGKVDGETSDGFHTFNELYRYRMLYNAAFFNLLSAHTDIPVVKSWRHGDGEECFGGGWFIVVAQLPTGQISNHYEAKDWDLFDIPAVELSPTWDGHTPNEAADNLEAFLAQGKKVAK